MDLVDAFLDRAIALVDPRQPSKTEQIDFRRAVSAASVSLPNRLKERLGEIPSEQDRKTADALTFIAGEFVALQQDRHSAYDNSKVWSYTEVENAITRAHARFGAASPGL
jgi:hypothetical protein